MKTAEFSGALFEENPNIPLEHTPGISKAPNERNSFINCWLGVWGMLHLEIIPFSKWLVTMVIVSPLTGATFPFQMAFLWLINGGDPNYLQVLGWSSKQGSVGKFLELCFGIFRRKLTEPKESIHWQKTFVPDVPFVGFVVFFGTHGMYGNDVAYHTWWFFVYHTWILWILKTRFFPSDVETLGTVWPTTGWFLSGSGAEPYGREKSFAKNCWKNIIAHQTFQVAKTEESSPISCM